MKQRHFTKEAAEVIRKLAASQGWDVGWLDDGSVKNRNQYRQLLAMAKVILTVSLDEPEPYYAKTGEVARQLGLSTAQLVSMVYRADKLGLVKPDMYTGKARWTEGDFQRWKQYKNEGRLPLREK